MEVVSSPETLAEIESRGGQLYVWLRRGTCCGAGTLTLATSFDPPAGRDFGPVPTDAGFDLFMPKGLGRLPDELHLALHRFPRRVDAYWDGCAWVV